MTPLPRASHICTLRQLTILNFCLVRGVYLTDLTFIEDGNPDEVDNLINCYKRGLVFRVVQEVQQYQATKYDYVQREPLLTFLTKLPVLSDKQLYDLSLQREPREKRN